MSGYWLDIALVAVLVLLNAVFAGSEMALVSLREGRLIGFEALLRWDRGGRGFVPPNKFIPIAEESGLIGPLGRVMVGIALATAEIDK